ncbi:MAG: HIT domain-containing protein [Actinobacteria bacterium ATB1]|nr:HIT domain-containing protein [Actinobacteria bacterium ATB1]
MKPDTDRIWAGWRIRYVESVEKETGADAGSTCVFCRLPALADDEGLVVWRGELVYVALNLYPYGTGHCMALPYRHVGHLPELTEDEATELMSATRRSVRVLDAAYGPDGFNVGANLGRAAGAGIPAHLHMHVLPRWSGDTNYISTIGGTRILPEDLPDTFARVAAAFASDETGSLDPR